MNLVQTVAKKVRHARRLRDLDSLWRVLRPAYRRMIDPFGHGVSIALGGRTVRFPAELLSTNPDWSRYERESFAALGAWLDASPGALTMLDVGCSFGAVTSFAVQVCPRVEVIAFDSDLLSLRAMEAVVPARAHPRVRRIDGLLGDAHLSQDTLASAVHSTLRRLPAVSSRAAITQCRFLCFGEKGEDTVPHHRLDTLLGGVRFPGPVLLKCDVEGGEMFVLRGATDFLRTIRPTLLLSVHHGELTRYGFAPSDVAALLRSLDYKWRVLAHDHEEHWWCESSGPRNSSET